MDTETTNQRVASASDLLARYAAGERDFRGANLRDADLYGADLSGADLRGADLRGAYLSGAHLRGAYLSGANLSDAYLYGADLSGADLYGAYLSGAHLRGADLRGANLYGANLSDADLSDIREDVGAVFEMAPHEAPGVLAALMDGRVDGSVYDGKCACLVGTIANLRHEPYTMLSCDLRPNERRPAERWFLPIRPGDTPENSPVAAISAGWLREWIAAHPEAVAK